MAKLTIHIVSLFPNVFESYLNTSMMAKASQLGAVKFNLVDLRDFGIGPRKQVDDTPYGGGDGMVLRVEPLVAAIEHLKADSASAKVILMSPRGQLFKQSTVVELAQAGNDLIIICARYEGYDERVSGWVDYQLSLGNYLVTGGELPALIVADALVRLLPGVLGGPTSAQNESFNDDQTKEHPHYTKPAVFQGKQVPGVLLSGDHQAIAKWRDDNQQSGT